MKIPTLTIDYKPRLPARSDYGIGLIGCGGIVDYAHLPAYRAHGLNIRACYDLDPATARRLADKHGIPKVCATVDELLADRSIEIVDIAVPAPAQRALAERALAAGKHLLCQKPLSENIADAEAIVAAGRAAGRKVAVNQQMRWSPGIAAAKDLVSQGLIGEPADIQIQVSVDTPFHMWPWLEASERYDLMYHTIHHLDSMRYIFGSPEWVTSVHTKYPGQTIRPETKTVTVLEYASGLQGLLAINHHDTSDAPYATFRFMGSDGVVSGTIGLLYDYPDGRPDTLQVSSKHLAAKTAISVELEGSWIPGAFIGPMASLMEAIQTDGTPVTDAADNLETLRIVLAGYLSSAERRAVRPSEISGTR
jgi:predicted dehydrogenase